MVKDYSPNATIRETVQSLPDNDPQRDYWLRVWSLLRDGKFEDVLKGVDSFPGGKCPTAILAKVIHEQMILDAELKEIRQLALSADRAFEDDGYIGADRTKARMGILQTLIVVHDLEGETEMYLYGMWPELYQYQPATNVSCETDK